MLQVLANPLLLKHWELLCEADQYFSLNGQYKYDKSKIGDAHEWCRNEVEDRMKENKQNSRYYPEIVVSNTFTQEWEMEPYFKLAKEYGYMVTSIIIENRHGGTNVHGVPEESIRKMKDRFEIKL